MPTLDNPAARRENGILDCKQFNQRPDTLQLEKRDDMTNGWNAANQLLEESAHGGDLFVKLASSGDKVVGVFCGEPFAHKVHWVVDQYQNCDGAQCEHCTAGNRASPRFVLNFYVIADGEMRIFKGSRQWYEDVVKVREKYGLDAWAFEIERRGDKGDTKTTYTILPDNKLEPDLIKKIQAAKLHDLQALMSVKGSSTAKPASTSAALIGMDAAQALATRLRALTKDDVQAFLAAFGIERVRELRQSDESAAQTFLSKCEGRRLGLETGELPF